MGNHTSPHSETGQQTQHVHKGCQPQYVEGTATAMVVPTNINFRLIKNKKHLFEQKEAVARETDSGSNINFVPL